MIKKESADRAVTIMQEAMEVNTNTNHHVFVNYSPHVNAISVEVYKDGWSEGKESEYLTEPVGLYLGDGKFVRKNYDRLINAIAELAEDVPAEFEEYNSDVATCGVDYPATM